MTDWSTRVWWLGGALLLLVAIYQSTSAQFLLDWGRNPLGHGYLVVPGAAYLAWMRRDRVRAVESGPAFWWLPILAVLAFVWLVADVTATSTVQQFCLTLMVVGFVCGALGSAAARELALPLGFLLFAVPIDQYVVPALQTLTAGFAVKLLQLSGFPVLLNQEMISVPGSSWKVTEACSGINYLMSALVMAYLYAGVVYRSFPRRLLFLLSAVPVALLANGIRVYITIGAAAAGSPMFASGPRHYLVGWIVFGAILGIMFLIGTRFEEPPAPVRASGVDSLGATYTPARGPRSWSWSTPGFVALGLMIVAMAPVSARRMTDTAALQSSISPTAAVNVMRPWTIVPGMALKDWKPQPQLADAIVDRTYRAGGSTVRINVALYGAQNGDIDVNRRPPGSLGWDVAATGVRSVDFERRQLNVNESLLTSPTGSVRVWHWYVVDGVTTARGYTAKLLLAASRLRGGYRSSGVVALATEDRVGIDSAAALRRFLELLALDLSSR